MHLEALSRHFVTGEKTDRYVIFLVQKKNSVRLQKLLKRLEEI